MRDARRPLDLQVDRRPRGPHDAHARDRVHPLAAAPALKLRRRRTADRRRRGAPPAARAVVPSASSFPPPPSSSFVFVFAGCLVTDNTTVGVLACGPAVPPPSSAFFFSDAGQPRDRGPRGRGRARPRARPRARRRDRALGYPLRGRPLLQRGAAGVARERVGARAARARPRAAQGRTLVLLGVVWGSVGSALPRGGGARSRGGRRPSPRVRSSPLSVVPGRALREARDPRASPVVGFDLRQLDVQVRRHAVSDVSRRVTPRRRGWCPQRGPGAVVVRRATRALRWSCMLFARASLCVPARRRGDISIDMHEVCVYQYISGGDVAN